MDFGPKADGNYRIQLKICNWDATLQGSYCAEKLLEHYDHCERTCNDVNRRIECVLSLLDRKKTRILVYFINKWTKTHGQPWRESAHGAITSWQNTSFEQNSLSKIPLVIFDSIGTHLVFLSPLNKKIWPMLVTIVTKIRKITFHGGVHSATNQNRRTETKYKLQTLIHMSLEYAFEWKRRYLEEFSGVAAKVAQRLASRIIQIRVQVRARWQLTTQKSTKSQHHFLPH